MIQPKTESEYKLCPYCVKYGMINKMDLKINHCDIWEWICPICDYREDYNGKDE